MLCVKEALLETSKVALRREFKRDTFECKGPGGAMNRQLALLPVTFALVLLFTDTVRAQSLDNDNGAIEVTEPPAGGGGYPVKGAKPGAKVGRKAAEKYMGPKQAETSVEPAQQRTRQASGPDAHFGFFFSDNAYKWGPQDSQTNVGKWNFGVTYRMGEWVNSADLGVRIDVSSYDLQDVSGTTTATKISFLPVLMFPDASSKFPLYFGAGAGLGVFMKQLANESALSLDYQLFGGVRFFDVIKNTGFFVEGGLKNHFLILSDGQYNGTFFSLGTVFSF
jgi:hypothetical protein